MDENEIILKEEILDNLPLDTTEYPNYTGNYITPQEFTQPALMMTTYTLTSPVPSPQPYLLPPEPALIVRVIFFCKLPDHNPSQFVRGRASECNLCEKDRYNNNWMYYCTQCEAEESPIRHYSAKHINNHVNNKHSGMKVERCVPKSQSESEKIQQYKRIITEHPNKTMKHSRNRRSVRQAPYTQQHSHNVNSEDVNMNPTSNLVGIMRDFAQQGNQFLEKIFHMGALMSEVRMNLLHQKSFPEDLSKVATIDTYFAYCLGYAKEVLPNELLAVVARLSLKVHKALYYPEKLNDELCQEFNDVANKIIAHLQDIRVEKFYLFGAYLREQVIRNMQIDTAM